MANELEQIPGVSWEEEAEVRRRVAADVHAGSSSEALVEKQAVEAAWNTLRQAEGTVEMLCNLPVSQRSTSYKFDLVAAQRAAEAAGQDVRRAENAAIVGQRRRAAVAAGHMAATAAARAAPVVVAPAQRVATEHGSRDTPAVVLPAAAAARVRPRALQAGAPADGTRRVGTGESIEDYSGGPVLPSVHQVGIADLLDTAADKFVDDGDVTLFESRQRLLRKRARESTTRERGAVVKPEERELEDEEDSAAVAEEVTARIGASRFSVSKAVHDALLDYQRVGVEWLLDLHERRTGGILGDEMGLGKTIQVAVLLHALGRSKVLQGPVLIVCPLTVLTQWGKELHKWAPMLRAVILHESGSATTSRIGLLNEVRGTPSVVITTYSAATNMIESLRDTGFQYVILDEGHKISNPAAHVTIAVKSFFTPHRLILTGSPIQNTLKELWCLFDFVCPGLLGNLNSFVKEFEEPIGLSKNPKASSLVLATAVECAKALKEHITPFMLRRLKKDVNANLPAKHERIIRCTLSDAQLAEYLAVLVSPEATEVVSQATLAKFDRRFDENLRDGQGCLWTGPYRRSGVTDSIHRLAFRVRWTLRFVCNHVRLRQLKAEDVADGGDGKNISFRSNNPVDYEGSAKLKTLRDLLECWKRNKHKVLVFSQTRMMLDILENMAEQEGHKYIRMDGCTPTKHRPLLIDAFNKDDSIFVALLTTKVGGLGVNLTGADRVVIFDPDWNPVTDEQARERAWRIGQKREVCVYRMISSGTVEEAVLHRQLAKTYVTDKVLNDPSLQRFFSNVSLEDSFLLGSEYQDRVSESHRHLVANTLERGMIQQEADQELQREEIEENRCAHVVRAPKPEEGDVKAEHDGDDDDAETAMLQSMVDGKKIVASGDRITRNLAAMAAKDTLRRATTAPPAAAAVQRGMSQASSARPTVTIPPRPRHK